jgi:hypothetical protein
MYFFNSTLKIDKRIATTISSKGLALGKLKFHATTPIKQTKYAFINNLSLSLY